MLSASPRVDAAADAAGQEAAEIVALNDARNKERAQKLKEL